MSTLDVKVGLSVVIPAYNEEKILADTIQTVRVALRHLQDETGLTGEVIVVDNMSTDRTAEIAHTNGARVLQHNIRNIASVRNAGIKAALHTVVVTVDADSLMPQNALSEIWKTMSSGDVVGGGVRVKSDSRKFSMQVVFWILDQIAKFGQIPYGMYFFKRDAALEVGGFPEDMLISEDVIFAKRMSSYAAKVGLRFINLRSVTIVTKDRKGASTFQFVKMTYNAYKSLNGKSYSTDAYDFWYNPIR